MDGIEGLDDGAYAHFTFQAKQQPGILRVMQVAYFFGSYVGISALLLLILAVFVLRRKWWPALVALLGFALAVGVIQLIQTWVPRARPQEAANFFRGESIFFLGDGANLGSYPSAGVLLFTLAMMLLGRAIWDFLPRLMRFAYVIAVALLVVWVCLAQFYLALHYVTDVLGGLAGGLLIGWIAYLLTRQSSPRSAPIG